MNRVAAFICLLLVSGPAWAQPTAPAKPTVNRDADGQTTPPAVMPVPKVGPPVDAAPERREGPWRISEKIDKLDNSKSVQATTSSKETDESIFSVRCQRNVTEAFVAWPIFVGSYYGAGVKWRTEDTPIRSEYWKGAMGGYGAFSRQPIPMVKALLGHTELVLNLTSRQAPSRTLSYDITGLEAAVAPIRKLCGW